MANIYTWSKTAASNNSSPPDGWPENMAYSSVNNCAREMMAAIAKFRDDNNGTITSGGTSTAYTVTTNSTWASYTLGRTVAFKIHTNSGSNPTLNVDGLGAISLYESDGTTVDSSDLVANRVYRAVYDSTGPKFWISQF